MNDRSRMPRAKTQEVLLTLSRQNAADHWGFSLVGGADVSTPLIVTRVAFGSPADGTLHRGDIITKIGSYDARDVRHQDAQHLFNSAGNNVRVVVQRQVLSRNPGLSKFLEKIAAENRGDAAGHNNVNSSTGSSRASSRNFNTPLSISPHLSPATANSSAGYYGNHNSYQGASPGGSALLPTYTTPFTPLDDYHFTVAEVPDIKVYRQSLSHNPNLDEQLVNQVSWRSSGTLFERQLLQ